MGWGGRGAGWGDLLAPESCTWHCWGLSCPISGVCPKALPIMHEVSPMWGVALGTPGKVFPVPALPGGRCQHTMAMAVPKQQGSLRKGREFCPISGAFGSKITQPRRSEMMCKRNDYNKITLGSKLPAPGIAAGCRKELCLFFWLTRRPLKGHPLCPRRSELAASPWLLFLESAYSFVFGRS